jgi:Tfp pilus assembly protein PilZ
MRLGVSIPAIVIVRDKPKDRIEAEIINISEGGAFVHCTAPIRIGQEIFLEIQFGETKLLAVKVIKLEDEDWGGKFPEQGQEKSVVKWVRGTSVTGFGVQFVDIKKDNKEFVKRLFHYFESLGKAGVSFAK